MSTTYTLFQVYGIELEYMLVQKKDLAIAPKVAELLTAKNGTLTDDINNGTIGWSNELVAHVVELKTQQPVNNLHALEVDFHNNIVEINELLKDRQLQLLGTSCHPFMNPFTETHIWEHGYHAVYELYNQIFNCKGHGWSNLQSMHINLPFSNDREFEQLHAAIRILLPILPGICASSPILDGQFTGFKDSRLENYKTNQKEIPIIAGHVIPERVYTQKDYHKYIFEPIKKALKPYDKNNILDHFFVNSRGAIARFDRSAIEIRVMDIQECPKADIAIAILVIETLKKWITNPYTSLNSQKKWEEKTLYLLLNDCINNAENAFISNTDYLQEFGIQQPSSVQKIWKHLYEQTKAEIPTSYQQTLEYILENGTLATRITNRLKNSGNTKAIQETYQELANCLQQNKLF